MLRPIPPISTGEFFQCLQRCIPPVGWSHTLAVANSAGPDSTCLLFLLSNVLKQVAKHSEDTAGTPIGLPAKLLSLHVNHDLQSVNTAMANRAEQNAGILNVQHETFKIPWGKAPYPEFPSSYTDTFEQVAREGRQHMLFMAMTLWGADTVAYAHHADDQVETAIMRMAMGSGPVGLGGMRPVRRWGMDGGEYGGLPLPEGMQRWVVRPLLWFSKDRILATCDANKLAYVNDPTNFQPHISVRNAIRHALREGKDMYQDDALKVSPAAVAKQIPSLQSAIEGILKMADALKDTRFQGREALREVVRRWSTDLDRVDTRVTNSLTPCLLPSPPSTLLISLSKLQQVRRSRVAIARRILRYVSPRPWGSPAAEARGGRAGLQNLVREIWRTSTDQLDRYPVPQRFNAPSTVEFWPMTMRDDQQVRNAIHPNEPLYWLLQRADPRSARKLAMEGCANPLDRDISKFLLGMWSKTGKQLIMFDCRFLLTFSLRDMPPDILMATRLESTKFLVKSYTSFYLPQVVMQRPNEVDHVLARVEYKDPRWRKLLERRIESEKIKEGGQKKDVHIRRDGDSWISIEHIRTLEAL